MARAGRILVFALAVGLAASACGEIVKVTADRTVLYDSETKQSREVKIKGSRFMVYAVSTDWYLVEMMIGGEKTFRLPIRLTCSSRGSVFLASLSLSFFLSLSLSLASLSASPLGLSLGSAKAAQ